MQFSLVFCVYSCLFLFSCIGATYFNLYHKENPDSLIDFKNHSFSSSKENVNAVVLIHGFQQNGDINWYSDFKSAYFNLTSYHYVIQVDWGEKAKSLNYFKFARQYVEKVGQDVAKFLMAFLDISKLPVSSIELTGFSLGAHIAGAVGKRINETLKQGIRRINALDPAGPVFRDENDMIRLRNDDAQTVVVYHTNGNTLGLAEAVGTADLYFNNIEVAQPGCGTDLLSLCSHHRVLLYFVDGLRTGSFVGIKCKSYQSYQNGSCIHNPKANFANTLTFENKGIYFASTNRQPPFDKHPHWNKSGSPKKLLNLCLIILPIWHFVSNLP